MCFGQECVALEAVVVDPESARIFVCTLAECTKTTVRLESRSMAGGAGKSVNAVLGFFLLLPVKRNPKESWFTVVRMCFLRAVGKSKEWCARVLISFLLSFHIP